MAQQPQQGAFDIQPTSQGPFSDYLNPTQNAAAPRWDSGQQFSGFEHTAGNIAGLGTKLLQGITSGRVRAYAQKEQQRLQTWNKVTEQYNAVQNDPDVDPQLKAQIRKQYYEMLGSVGQEQLKDSKSTKDKGVRGQVAGVLNSVFEKLSGGPVKGDALTTEKMADFMGTVAKAVNSGTSASTAYQKQFGLIQQGISETEATQKATGSPITAISRDQAIKNPKVSQALSWFSTYAPSQLSVVDQILPSTARGNIKELAGASLASLPQHQKYPSGAAAPPSTQAQSPGGAASTAKVPGYLDAKYPAPPQTSGPPQTSSVPSSQITTERYNESVGKEDDDRRYLQELAGVSQELPLYDTKDNLVGMGSREQFNANQSHNNQVLAQRRLKDSEERTTNTETRLDASAKQRTALLKTQADHWTKDYTLKQRSAARADAALGLQRAKYNESLNTSRPAEEVALNKFIKDNTEAGVPFDKVADNIDSQLAWFKDDPIVSAHMGYIRDHVASIKNKENGWSSLAGAGPAPPLSPAKPKAGAPPATNKPVPVDVKSIDGQLP